MIRTPITRAVSQAWQQLGDLFRRADARWDHTTTIHVVMALASAGVAEMLTAGVLTQHWPVLWLLLAGALGYSALTSLGQIGLDLFTTPDLVADQADDTETASR